VIDGVIKNQINMQQDATPKGNSIFRKKFWSSRSYGVRFLFREKIARVAFYYKERQYVTSRRGELYGPADFLGKYH
jgi:hypothetical protein